MGPLLGLVFIVTLVLSAGRLAWCQRVLRYLPTPLWCYLLPMAATAFAWLPQKHPTYGLITSQFLPFALGLLLLNVHLPTVLRVGWRALAAMGIGALSIVVGAPLIAWCVRPALPPEAWKGIGSLAATWTGGSLNLLAVRTILETPESIFTALIITDALIAYGWMAMLVTIASHQAVIDRWLRAVPVVSIQTATHEASLDSMTREKILGLLVAGGITGLAILLARWCPLTPLISSRSGWVLVLVTTLTLAIATLAPLRAIGAQAAALGQPCLFLVLAAMGAQASLANLLAVPVWLGIGVGVAIVHGATLLMIGRWMRLPLGLLATASQANFGGVISAPLVGAIYRKELAPIGLCLAIAGNALGTYLGLASASLLKILDNIT